MGLTQIAASILTSILVGVLARGTRRTFSLLALSVLAIYWFQPVVPLRSFDFWFPSLSLALMVLTWFITSQPGVWRTKQNAIGLLIIIGVVMVIDLSRYFLTESIIIIFLPLTLNNTTEKLVALLKLRRAKGTSSLILRRAAH